MRKLWDSVDLHIVLILVLACPVVFLSSWWLALPLFAPQGIIYVHVFWDHPAPGPRPWAYLVANELLVLMVEVFRIDSLSASSVSISESRSALITDSFTRQCLAAICAKFALALA